eukprot:5621391-Amphidinium_carterae.1
MPDSCTVANALNICSAAVRTLGTSIPRSQGPCRTTVTKLAHHGIRNQCPESNAASIMISAFKSGLSSDELVNL